ncbi:MAG: cyclic nucleotide-binding domain-containing protein [Gammaproteobacteria bacterium]
MQQGDKLLDVVEQAVREHHTFGDLLLAEEKQYLLDHGVVRSVQEGEYLCRQNQLDTRVFILVIGEMEVSQGEGESRRTISRLRRGDLFGEISALFKTPRVSDVIATKPSVLLEIPGEVLEKIVSSRSELLDSVLRMYKERVTDTSIRSVSAFRTLNEDMIQKIISESSLLSIPAGGILVKEGEKGDALYVIIHGMARVSHGFGTEHVNLALLRAGDYFGEWSLMTGDPRAASVSAITRLDAVRIDCKTFQDFIKDNPEVRERLDLEAQNRHDILEDSMIIPETKEQVRTVVSEIESILNQDKLGS